MDPRPAVIARRLAGIDRVVAVTGGVLAETCGEVLRDFFRARRVKTPAE